MLRHSVVAFTAGLLLSARGVQVHAGGVEARGPVAALTALLQGALGAEVLGSSPSTTRVSVSSAGVEGDADSTHPSVSGDGRFVAFRSGADNLVAGDTNLNGDVFVHDRQMTETTRVSVGSSGNQGNEDSGYWGLALSSNGRYVAFISGATTLVSPDTNGWDGDVYVHDRQTGRTSRVSVDSLGNQADDWSFSPSISATGRYVAFESDATNLVQGDTNAHRDIFVHDRQTRETSRVSVDSSGGQANGLSLEPSLSSDGRCVAFWSDASNLVPGDTDGVADVFVHDRETGQTTRVSVDSSGNQTVFGGSSTSSISGDGRYVAFESRATNLVPGDTNTKSDVFVHDRQTGQTTRISVDSSGRQVNGDSDFPSVSANGRYIAFRSEATNLVSDDTNGEYDVFLHDCLTGKTTRASVDSSGSQANGESGIPCVSGDGRYVTFRSYASNLAPGDTNSRGDVFVRDQGILETYQPDLMIRNLGATAYLGKNVYNTTAAKQTATQNAAAGLKAVYQLQFQNDGTVADTFTVGGTKSSAGCTVTYFDRLAGGKDITGKVTSTGWRTASLSPGAKRGLRVEVMVKPGTPVGAKRTVLVTGTSVACPTVQDVTKAVTVVEAAAGPVVIRGLTSLPAGTGAQILLSLAAPARLDVRLLNLAGKPVRTLCRTRPCQVGANTFLWDGRSDQGLRAPNGVYLLDVFARGADGTSSRAVARVGLGG